MNCIVSSGHVDLVENRAFNVMALEQVAYLLEEITHAREQERRLAERVLATFRHVTNLSHETLWSIWQRRSSVEIGTDRHLAFAQPSPILMLLEGHALCWSDMLGAIVDIGAGRLGLPRLTELVAAKLLLVANSGARDPLSIWERRSLVEIWKQDAVLAVDVCDWDAFASGLVVERRLQSTEIAHVGGGCMLDVGRPFEWSDLFADRTWFGRARTKPLVIDGSENAQCDTRAVCNIRKELCLRLFSELRENESVISAELRQPEGETFRLGMVGNVKCGKSALLALSFGRLWSRSYNGFVNGCSVGEVSIVNVDDGMSDNKVISNVASALTNEREAMSDSSPSNDSCTSAATSWGSWSVQYEKNRMRSLFDYSIGAHSQTVADRRLECVDMPEDGVPNSRLIRYHGFRSSPYVVPLRTFDNLVSHWVSNDALCVVSFFHATPSESGERDQAKDCSTNPMTGGTQLVKAPIARPRLLRTSACPSLTRFEEALVTGWSAGEHDHVFGCEHCGRTLKAQAFVDIDQIENESFCSEDDAETSAELLELMSAEGDDDRLNED